MCKVSIYILWKCWCQHQPCSLPNDSCFWFNTGFYVGKNTNHCVRHKCCGIKYYRYDDVTIWDVELGTLNDFKTMGKYFLNLTSRNQNKTVFLHDTAPPDTTQRCAADVERIMQQHWLLIMKSTHSVSVICIEFVFVTNRIHIFIGYIEALLVRVLSPIWVINTRCHAFLHFL